jgi:L-alanine-DL-glutamate epimerase-like enolase superfamily enzyme
MKIARVEPYVLHIPFYADHVVAAMQRAQTHDESLVVMRVELDDGTVGWGDTQGGPARFDSAHLESLVGANPLALLLDDGLGFALQVALLDAVGKATDTPAHALLGRQVRDRCPLSWWDIDMPPGDWVKEAEASLSRGYTTFKMKARPWRDVHEQIDAVGQIVPRDYRFDIDFNGFLLTPARAEEHLTRLDEHVNVGMYESPFYLQRDLTGAKILRERVTKPVIEHFQPVVLHAHASDGFVVGGGIEAIRQTNALAAEFNKPYWLQLVGNGLTTAFALHIGSVMSHAQLPYITCFELFEDDLLTSPIELVDGYAAVPDGPGLGVDVDEAAIAKYCVEPGTKSPKQLYREQKRILRVRWSGSAGQTREWAFTAEENYQRAFYAGSIPPFQEGVHLDVTEDDGSAGFASEHESIAAKGW